MAEISAGTVYEINKNLSSKESPLDVIALSSKLAKVAVDMMTKKYMMLLCHERRDYTIFKSDKATKNGAIADLRECLCNRGDVVSIDRTEDEGAWEIWIRDNEENEDFCYYLFDYEIGVIEVK